MQADFWSILCWHCDQVIHHFIGRKWQNCTADIPLTYSFQYILHLTFLAISNTPIPGQFHPIVRNLNVTFIPIPGQAIPQKFDMAIE